MLVDTLQGLSLHRPSIPPTFHLSSVKEFVSYATWPRAEAFVGRGEHDDDVDNGEEEDQIL